MAVRPGVEEEPACSPQTARTDGIIKGQASRYRSLEMHARALVAAKQETWSRSADFPSPMLRVLHAIGICAIIVAAACASPPTAIPANVTVGATAQLPAPRYAKNEALPQILAMRFSTLDVSRGNSWSAQIVTGTNVASVEVRTNLFSIDVPRTSFGRFAYALDVLDVPPIFVRAYRLRVLARNSAGIVYEEDLPFRIR
jgi:hypothetical protein